jgi:hypothetical protein
MPREWSSVDWLKGQATSGSPRQGPAARSTGSVWLPERGGTRTTYSLHFDVLLLRLYGDLEVLMSTKPFETDEPPATKGWKQIVEASRIFL